MANDAVPYWDPADTLTGYASAALTGKRFVRITGARTDGLPTLAVPADGDRCVGVTSRDVALGGKVMFAREGVWPVTAGAALTAGQEVQADATGKAIPLAAGKSLGVVLDDVANGADAPIALSV